MLLELTESEIERFHSKIDRSGSCWLWTKEVNNKGYGRFGVWRNGKAFRLLAHRLAYELATGVDPGKRVVRHGCDTPACCTPTCLLLGTQADNIQDAVVRGRMDTSGLAAYRDVRDAAVIERLAVGVKTCSWCWVAQPFNEFNKNRSTPDGLQYHCKTCRALARRGVAVGRRQRGRAEELRLDEQAAA